MVPRTTRSGKVFDNRRYSTLNHLSKLVIKEEPKVEEEDENNAMMGIETTENVPILEAHDEEEAELELTEEIDLKQEQSKKVRVRSRKKMAPSDGSSMTASAALSEHEHGFLNE